MTDDIAQEITLYGRRSCVVEDDSGQEIQYMLDAQAEFMKEVILMAFRNMLSS